MQTFSTRRAGGVFVTLGFAFVALIGRVAYLQTVGRQETIGKADRQQHEVSILISKRGGIFDCHGLALALTIQKEDLFADPHFMQEVYQEDGHSVVEMDDAIQKLARLIDRDPLELAQQLNDRGDSRFLRIAQDVDETRQREIEKLNIPGIGFEPTNVRIYPNGSLAAHILGGTGKDGHGLEGIELQFDKLLSGKDGWERKLKDARRRAIGVAADDYLPPEHGKHLVLTIDANLQMIAEQELAESCKEFHAKHGEVVVMDPRTGEILALANYPTFDPNDLDSASNELRRDRCLTDPYEPGSTIKPFIVGPALQWGQTTLTEIWHIPGIRYITPYGRTITDVHGYGPLATWDVLVKSSNIGMSMLGERLGNEKLHRALASWGYGKPTGVELPGESGGKLNPLKKWSKYSTESASQGYEIMVTPLQLCRGFCAYANGGKLVQPTLIRGVLDSDGKVISRVTPAELGILPQVVDPQTAREVRSILCDVVVRGTAAGYGRSDTWNIFGKTGTAHISMGRAGYSETKFNSSFICAAPAENPRLVVAMVVHEPDRAIAHYGGSVAAPASKRFLERALSYLQVPPSPELQPPPENIASVLWNFNAKAYKRKVEKTETALRD
ncbi:MAG TPA: penicillin-binding protein 2 [Tepidisphaeraceae bacterium]|jgi:cell division protein FtsI/penicillin-binding protein 2|nr:penicillin-binding protein 2 [Tepidisphaeraceae bacterium]